MTEPEDARSSPGGPVPTARPGVSPTVRWVAIAAATVAVALLSRLTRWLRRGYISTGSALAPPAGRP
ncbi:hypothetical protein [Pseudonocardia spinosispora]|uniref:hypothetical protein n=1 Tax=Pseudonocardia spinosispora TaxID=103441 RepID=UPI000403A385|nr:hypothetical protein [Pseudonocardia spinosispora]